jgi:hypothetical protein
VGRRDLRLLTRWNPLNIKRPYALEYNGKNVLVVGLGPGRLHAVALPVNEGFRRRGDRRLKIEPLPDDITGTKDAAPRRSATGARSIAARRARASKASAGVRVRHHRPVGQELPRR